MLGYHVGTTWQWPRSPPAVWYHVRIPSFSNNNGNMVLYIATPVFRSVQCITYVQALEYPSRCTSHSTFDSGFQDWHTDFVVIHNRSHTRNIARYFYLHPVSVVVFLKLSLSLLCTYYYSYMSNPFGKHATVCNTIIGSVPIKEEEF